MKSNIIYANHDGVDLDADFYQPVTRGVHPIIIAVHGGSWRSGNAEFYQYIGPYLAQHGYALLAINFRQLKNGKNRYPAAVDDVRAAVQFVRENSKMLNIDPERIGIMGDAAGAHLAALVALEDSQKSQNENTSSVNTLIKTFIGVCGIYDMAAQWNHDLVLRSAQDNISENYLGFSLPENRKLFFESSPISYVTKPKYKMSFMLAWGTENYEVDSETQSVAFMKALKQSGFRSIRTTVLPGAGHFWIMEPIHNNSYSGIFVSKLLQFIGRGL